MEQSLAEVRFLEIVYHFVKREHFRLIHWKEEGGIVWLEDERPKQKRLLRLQLRSYDWNRQLQTDLGRAEEAASRMRRQVNMRRAEVINIVFMPFAPVDEYETDRALPFTGGSRGSLRHIGVPMDALQDTLFPLASELGLKEMPPYIARTQLESEEDREQFSRTLTFMIRRMHKEELESDQQLFQQGKPRLTFVLLAAIILVYMYAESIGSTTSTSTLIALGAKFDPLILQGEWWRFFSAAFLHIGGFHLFMNGLALFYLGTAVERMYGTGRFLYIYTAAAFFGSIASFTFNDNVSAGASGAIFGLFGALLFFGVVHRRVFFRTFGLNIIVILLINLAFGFLVPMVDNGAHMGGLAGGFLAAATAGLPGAAKRSRQLLAFAASAAGAVILLTAGYSQTPEGEALQAVYYEMGREALADEREEEAAEYLERSITLSDQQGDEAGEITANAYFLLSYTEIQAGRDAEAASLLQQAVEIEDNFHEAWFNLALITFEQGNTEEAAEYVQKALNESREEPYLELEERINEELDG
ncbi:rhomboid family intramembrane serine protease [Alkalicoccus urumqiensis]|uniref:Rhomboid family intramembrane serine protease n=1 Tax=Alkalicoccus urumqiensis TaxID=1548213 RepID=A0A2P6MK76_ALKUR|nr:rhomboid family intramembrane serine protease [Alkalicoccus urumqiensis]PRO66677.1 rhomboid family intramembrane serine protease [Alkalicoccus urumqiensis]